MSTAAPLARLRRNLSLTTALVGGVVGIGAAHAQSLPNGATLDRGAVTFRVDGGASVTAPSLDTTGAARLDVDLGSKGSVITWGNFDVLNGSTLSFNNQVAGGGVAAVLNRVNGGNPASTIAGTLTSDPSVAVYILNPNGITFGAGANVNVGALIAGSLDNDGSTFTDLAGSTLNTGTLRFGTAPTSTAGVTVAGGTTFAIRPGADPSLGQMVLLGAFVDVGAGATLPALSDAAFVAGTDITMTNTAGSPLGFTITTGTTVPNAITVGGTVGGRNVTLAFASQDAVTDAILNVTGAVTATVATATDRGVVLSAGQAVAGAVTLGGTGTGGAARIAGASTTSTIHATTFDDGDPATPALPPATATLAAASGVQYLGAITAAGAASATSAGGAVAIGGIRGSSATVAATGGGATVGTATADAGDVSVSASGAAEVTGAVTATGGRYLVTGSGVTLGDAGGAAVTQQATGTVTITSGTAGSITGRTGLTLTSNSDNDLGDQLTLASGSGGIAFAAGTQLNGALDRSADVVVGNADAPLMLGAVSARGLIGSVGARQIARSTAITTGALDLRQSLDLLTTNGAAITTGGITVSGAGQGITLNAAGALAAPATIVADGDVALTTGGALTFGTVAATAGTATLTAGTTLDGGTASGGAGLVVQGADARLGTGNSSGGAVSLTATNGSATLGAADAATSVTVSATNGPATVSGTVAARNGDYLVTGTGVALGSGTASTQAATGAVTITSNAAFGGIVGGAGLTLIANSDGQLAEALTLAPGSAGINFAAGSRLRGGTARQSDVIVGTADTPLALGDVDARGLIASTGARQILRGRTITTGTLALAQSLDLMTTGAADIATGAITIADAAQPLSLRAGGFVSTGALAARDDVTVVAGAGATLGPISAAPAGADVRVTTATGLLAPAIIAGGLVALSADTGGITLAGTVAAGGTVTLLAGNGGAIGGLGGISVTSDADGSGGDDLTLDTTGAIAFAATSTLNAGNARQSTLRIRPGGPLTLGNVNALTVTDIGGTTLNRAAATTVGDVLTTNALTISTAPGQSLTTGTVRVLGAGQDLTLDAGGTLTAAAASSTRDVALRGTALTLTGGAAAARDLRLSATAGTLQVRSADAGGLLAMTQAGAGELIVRDFANGATGVSIVGDGALRVASATSTGGALFARSATGEITGATETERASFAGINSYVTAEGGRALLRTVTGGTGNATVVATTSIDVFAVTADGAVGLTAPGGIIFGTISGSSATATATNGMVTGTLATSTNGVTLDGRSVRLGTGLSSAGGVALTATAGAATLDTAIAANDVTLDATGGDAIVTGYVAAGRDYLVRGNAVALGVDAAPDVEAETQRAGRTVRIRATEGAIAGGERLSLYSDADNNGNGNVELDAAGGIMFAASGTINAGADPVSGAPTRTGDVLIRQPSGSALALGAVNARGLYATDAGAAATDPLAVGGSVTLGNVSTINALSVSAGGALSAGTIDVTGAGQGLTLAAVGPLAAQAITAAGDVALGSSGDAATLAGVRSVTGMVGINAAGPLGAGAVVAQGNAVATGGSGVTLASLTSAAGLARATATTGDLAVTTLSGSTGAEAIASSGAVAADTVTTTSGIAMIQAGGLAAGRNGPRLSIGSTNGAVSVGAGFARLGSASAGTTTTVGAGGIDATSATAGTALTLVATTGDLVLGTGSAGAGAFLQAAGSGGDIVLTSLGAGGTATVAAGRNVRAGMVTTTNGGGIGVVATNGEVTGRDPVAGRANLTAAGPLSVAAGTLARLDTISAGDDARVTAQGLDLTSASARDIALYATAGDAIATTLAARDDIAIRATGAATGTSWTSGAAPTPAPDAFSVADMLTGTTLAGNDVDVRATTISIQTVRANGGLLSDIRLDGAIANAADTDFDLVTTGNLLLTGPVEARDVVLGAGGDITTGDINAHDDILIGVNAGPFGHVSTGALVSGATIDARGPVDVAGAADAVAGPLKGNDLSVTGGQVTIPSAIARNLDSDLNLTSFPLGLTLGSGSAGAGVTLVSTFSPTVELAVLGAITAGTVGTTEAHRDLTLTSTGNIRVGTATSLIGNLIATATGNQGQVTGNGVNGRADLFATGTGADVMVSAPNLVRLGTVTAVRDVIVNPASNLTFWMVDLTAASGRDIALRGGTVTATTLTARDDIAIRASGAVTGMSWTAGGGGTEDAAGAADALLPGTDLTGKDIDVQGSTIAINTVAAAGGTSDVRFTGTIAGAADGDLDVTAGGAITLTGATSARDVKLAAGTIVRTGAITARDDIAITAAVGGVGPLTSGASIGALGPVDVAGAADAFLGGGLAGHDIVLAAGALGVGTVRALGAGSDFVANTTTSLTGADPAGDLDIAAGGDVTIRSDAAGRDVALSAGGAITTLGLSARDDIALRATGAVATGTLVSGIALFSPAQPAVDAAGAADMLAGVALAGNDVDVRGASAVLGTATATGAGSDLRATATTGRLALDGGSAGAAATLDKQGQADELVVNGVLTAGVSSAASDARLTSSTNLRVLAGQGVVSRTGAVFATATGAISGIAPDTRASFSGAGDVTLGAGPLALLGNVNSGGTIAITATGQAAATTLTADNSVSVVAGSIDAPAITARTGTLNLQATTGSVGVFGNLSGAISVGGAATIRAVDAVSILNLSAASATVTAGGRIFFSNLTTGGATNLDGGSVQASTLGVGTDLVAIARTGEARFPNATVGGSATISTLGAAGDLLVGVRSGGSGGLQAGGDVILASARNARLGGVVSGGAIRVSATAGEVTGFDPAAGADLTAARAVTVDGGTLARLGAVTAGSDLAVTADMIEVATGNAGTGALSLVADAGGVTLGTGSAGTTALVDASQAATVGTLVSAGTATVRAGGAAMVGTVRSTGASVAVTGASASVDNATAATALALTASGGNATLGTGIAGTTASVGASQAANVAMLTSGGAATIMAGTGATVGTVRSTGASVTVNGASAGVGSATAASTLTLAANAGDLSLGTGNAGGAATLSASGAASVTGGLTAASASLTAGGAATVAAVTSTGGAIDLTAARATIGTLVAATNATLTARAGDLALTSGTTGGTATLATTGGGGNVLVTSLSSGGTASIASVAGAQLGDVTARSGNVQVTATGGTVTGIGATGAANLRATAGAVNVAGGSLARLGTVDAGTLVDVTADSVSAGAVSARGGTLRLVARTGTLGVTSAAASGAATLGAGGAATVGTLAAGGAATLSSGTSFALTGATAGTTFALDAGTTATIGTGGIRVGGTAPVAANTLTIRATDVELGGTGTARSGAIVAGAVTLVDRNASGTLRLGDATGAGSGFALGDAEIDLIATPTLTLDATAGGTPHNIAIGTLSLTDAAGSGRVDVLTSGRIDVVGTVTGAGPGSAVRTLRLGGTNSATGVPNDAALATQIVATATIDAGGRILLTGATNVDLRANRIAFGQASGFLSPLQLTSGGAGVGFQTVANQYISNSASTLYNAQGIVLGGGNTTTQAYTQPNLLTASTLTVRYGDYALFQNTGQSLSANPTTGVVVNSLSTPTLALTSQGSPSGAGGQNGLALFGIVNDRTGTSAALLGGSVIATSGVNPVNSRINGCLIGSGGGGCLITAVAPPQINVFDSSQSNVFRTADDLAVQFDPVVGTNNESLFSDLGAIDFQYDEVRCDPATDATCAPETGTEQ